MLFEGLRVRHAANRAGLIVGRFDDGYKVYDSYGTELGGLLAAREVVAIGRECGGQPVEF